LKTELKHVLAERAQNAFIYIYIYIYI